MDEAPATRLRITLELRRSDDPHLFDALARLDKGRRRVARLRTLAHDGLMASRAALSDMPSVPADDVPHGPASGGLVDEHAREAGEHTELAPLGAEITDGIFEMPSAEEME